MVGGSLPLRRPGPAMTVEGRAFLHLAWSAGAFPRLPSTRGV